MIIPGFNVQCFMGLSPHTTYIEADFETKKATVWWAQSQATDIDLPEEGGAHES